MSRKFRFTSVIYVITLPLCLLTPRAFGQAAPQPQPQAPTPAPGAVVATTAANQNDEEVVNMSPFTVDETLDQNTYRADTTLAGSRVRTNLDDVASAINVVTAQFLEDTNSHNNQDLLVYTPNTEVGGMLGNFGGMGNSEGISELSQLLNPQANTRIRGLAAADSTRDYFLTDIPWDDFNTDRIDMQRGPNSILFGVGSPAGIINDGLQTAHFGPDTFKIQNQIGSFGSLRDSVNINVSPLKDELAIRVAGVNDQEKYQQEYAFNDTRRTYVALRFDPKILNKGSAHTSFSANYEQGVVSSNNPRMLPPIDAITPYFAANAINKQTFEPFQTQAGVTGAWVGDSASSNAYYNPWVSNIVNNLQNYDPVFWYNNSSGAPFNVAQSNIDLPNYGIGSLTPSVGTITGDIGGMPFSRPVGINAFSQYTINQNLINPSMYPAASEGIYKDRTLQDPSIFNFYDNLIDGPNKKEWQNWNAVNLDLSQSFFNDHLAFDIAYDHQAFNEGQEENLGQTPVLTIDINSILFQYPAAYGFTGPTPAVANPNIGRPYIGNSGQSGNDEEFTTRGDFRITGTGDFDTESIFGKGILSKIFGRHQLTGLYDSDDHYVDSRNFLRYATTIDWAESQGDQDQLSDAARQVNWVTYLGPSLSNLSSASGANIPGITAVQAPYGTTDVLTYNSHWNAPNVNPAAPWVNPFYPAGDPLYPLSNQSNNPANYVGYQEVPATVLNADMGDINQLYTQGSKTNTTIISESFVWQGFLLDDTVVPTFGWRRDTVRTYSANAPTDATGLASMDYDIDGATPLVSVGDSRTWGVVVHTPKMLRDKLPWGSDISLTFDDAQNFQAQNRVDFYGNPLPNAAGTTKEYGIVLSTLHNRLTFKVTKYDTKVQNATLTGALGAEANQVYFLQQWSTLSALQDYWGINGLAPGDEWYWNWAYGDSGNNPAYLSPTSAAFLNSPDTAAEKAAYTSWFAQLPPQSFWNAYGLPINTAAIQSGNQSQIVGAVAGWTPYAGTGALVPAGGGNINGLVPTGTENDESKGEEFELTANVTPNWNITINASKTTAVESALGASLVNVVNHLYNVYMNTPAGQLRLWYNGAPEDTLQYTFVNGLWAAYQFNLESVGTEAPEIRPWRFNAVTNYSFSRGFLKGVNVGGGFRFQQGQILGYGLNAAQTGLDANKPIWGADEGDLDGWIGYSRRLTRNIDWKIQLNLRNIGEKPHLIEISAEPDGTAAAERIVDGTTWTLTNTLSF